MCCWDDLPDEIKLYIISFIGQIYKDAATKIQIKWINYTIPRKVCILLAKEQMNYDVPDKWYFILDIRLAKYLEYFVKHGVFGCFDSNSRAIWVPLLNYLHDDFEIFNDRNYDDDDIACYNRVHDAYKALTKKIYSYNKYKYSNTLNPVYRSIGLGPLAVHDDPDLLQWLRETGH
jgi:hypothetical protein